MIIITYLVVYLYPSLLLISLGYILTSLVKKIGKLNLKLYLKFMYSVFEVCVLFGLGAKVISSGCLLLSGDEFVSCLLVWIMYAGCSVTSRPEDSTRCGQSEAYRVLLHNLLCT